MSHQPSAEPTQATQSIYRNPLVRHFMNYSLRAKLIMSFILVVLISVGVLSLLNDFTLRIELTRQVGQSLQNLATTKSQSVGDFIAKQVDTLEALTVNPVLQTTLEEISLSYNELSSADIERQLQARATQWTTAANSDPLVQDILTPNNAITDALLSFRNRFPENEEIIVTDRAGVLVAATNRVPQYRHIEESWWQNAYKENRGSIDLSLSEDGERIFVAVPIYGQQTPVVVGILRATLSIQTLNEPLRIDETGAQQVVDLYLPGGILLVRNPDGTLRLETVLSAEQNNFQQFLDQEQVYTELTYRNQARFASRVPLRTNDPSSMVAVSSLNWFAIAHQPRDAALQVVNASIRSTALTGLITLFVAGGLALLVAQALARPIIQLTQTVRQVADGNLQVQANVSTQDEIGTLARTFNTMTAELRQAMDKLTRRTDQLQRANNQLKTSARVGQQVTSILDLDALLAAVVDLIQARFGYYFVGVWLLNAAEARLKLHAMAGDTGGSKLQPGYAVPLTQHKGGQAAGSAPYELIENLQTTTTAVASPPTDDNQSHLAVPLRLGREVVGVLDIRSHMSEAFQTEDLLVLQTLANQIAVAINNARLYQQEQNRRHWAEALEQSGRVLSSTLDLRRIPDLILTQLTTVVPYERGSVLVQDGKILRPQARKGYPPANNPQSLDVPVRDDPDDVFQQIVRQRTYMILDDTTIHPGWRQLDWLPIDRSWLGVPLISRNKVIGIVSLTRHEAGAFSVEDARLVQTYAGQAAIALQNARLYAEITRFNEQLEQMVQERTEELNIALQNLARMDQAKGDFIKVTSHELRTPLTIIHGYTQLLESMNGSQENGKRDLLEGILNGTKRMKEIVDTMLDVSKIDEQVLVPHLEDVLLPVLLEQVRQTFTTALNARNLTLTLYNITQLPMIKADPDLLTKVFNHLVGNAIKYTPDGGRIDIAGRTVQPPDGLTYVELAIRDTGVGIDPEHLNLIFEKFYQTGELALHSSGKTRFKGGGPGLGLAIARGIVLAHGGRIWAESAGRSEKTLPGSIFYVQLPVGGPPPEARLN